MIIITKLSWDNRNYESGLDRGVFYPKDGPGEAWNGLTSVNESPSSNEQTRYIDGVKTHYHHRSEDFSGTIETFSYPKSFYENVLTQNRCESFGLSYRVDSDGGYKIHLVYNVVVSPTSFDYRQSDTDSFSWVFTTRPLPIPGVRLSAHLIIDTSKAYSWTVAVLEDILYGSETEAARLPLPEEVLDIFEANSILQVIDHGDGTFTVNGPNSAIQMLDTTTFQITWPSAVYIDAVSYTISSL